MKLLLLMIALFLPSYAAAAIPGPRDFSSYNAKTPDGETITWHLDNRNVGEPGPVIVYLPGSGHFPLFQIFDDGLGFGVPTALLQNVDRSHIVLFDKPGIPFEGHLKFDAEGDGPVFEAGPAYKNKLSRKWLVDAAVAAGEQALQQLGSRATQVVVLGVSEGGQYVFEVARRLPRTTHAVSMGANVLSQYFDFVIEARLAAERGEITREEAQRRVEALYGDMAAIAKNPDDNDKQWMGHSYRRWATFATHSPLEEMLALDIPLLLVYGGADSNSPILNADYAKIAFLNAGKSNLEYWVYPNADHFLREPDPVNPAKNISRSAEAIDRLWQWIEATE